MMAERSNRMVTDPALARRFINTYMAFLGTLVSAKDRQHKRPTEWLVIGRKRFTQEPETLGAYRAKIQTADTEMLDAIESLQVRRWVYLKDTTTYSVWVDDKCEQAYGVLGLTEFMRDLVPGGSGAALHTGLIALGGRWVTDGLFEAPVWLGPGYRRDFTAAYQRLRKAGSFSLGPTGTASD